MRVASASTHTMAFDAIGVGALIMTGGTGKNITLSSPTVVPFGASTRPHPSRRMRVECTDTRSAHTLLDVTAVASLRLMTTQAGCGRRACLHRVTGNEVR